MTLIEGREALEPRILGKRQQDQDSIFDESGSDEEFLIANEGYPDDDEGNNNRDFFSLPTLGLNYLNNLNLSLNLSLNLRNSPLWRMYENTTFTKPGFLANYLGKHTDDLDLNEHDISPDTRGYFTIANFLRKHGFPSYEEDYSEEAILERIRFKKLQQQAARAEQRKMEAENDYISNYHSDQSKSYLFSESLYEERLQEIPKLEQKDVEVHGKGEPSLQDKTEPELATDVQETTEHVKEPSALNPFYHRVHLTVWDKIKIGIITCTVLPIRVVLMIITLLLALLLSHIGMYGVSLRESQCSPLPPWRRGFRWVLANIVMRMFVFCSGFVWSIKETGKRATPEEAPIFVVGPHSSYFDAFAVILLGAPSVVAKLSTKDIPVFGRLVTFTQAVYVSRESKGSRKQTMETLKQRAQDVHHGNGMPQIFIFPEGTCSNRSSLIKFKIGAFAPQVPVQPVLIRYPNKFDASSWTFDGPPAVWNIWYALSQLYNKIEIEYLPVYTPNEDEKNDPHLYADNVRKIMAEALDVPMSDYQFEDGTLLCTMREKLVQKLRFIHRAKKALGLSGSINECSRILEGKFDEENCKMDFHNFQREYFHVCSDDTVIPEVQSAFNCLKNEDSQDVIDIRPYLMLTSIIYEEKMMIRLREIPRIICKMYGLKEAEVTRKDILLLMEKIFEIPESESDKTCSQLASEEIEHRIARVLEFAKLFTDEVTERLPKNYPSREHRDKPQLPSEKLKCD